MGLKMAPCITKSKIHYFWCGGEVNFPTLDAESKSAKILNSLHGIGRVS